MNDTHEADRTHETRQCAYQGCSEPAWPSCPNGFCIYHSPDNGADKEIAMCVWRAARRQMTSGLGRGFAGWQFPRDPEQRHFDNIHAVVPCEFCGAVFVGDVLFSRCVFAHRVAFRDAIFNGAARFDGTRFDGAAAFIGTRFCGGAWFIGNTWAGLVNFVGAEFQKNSGFFGNRFGGPLIMSASFRGSVSLQGTAFMDQVLTAECAIPSGDMHIGLPRRRWWIAGEARPFRRPEQGEGLYRLAKQAAQNAGDYRAAGDYHFAEQCAIETGRRGRATKWPWKRTFWSRKNWLLCLPELVAVRWVFGYGEKPWRVVLTAGILILGCALAYCLRGGIEASDGVAFQGGDWWQSLYFSIVAFTTLGFGDLRPAEGWRLVVALEAFFGAGLMAALVVSLTRRYMR